MTEAGRSDVDRWPEEGVLFPVGGVRLRVLPGDHPFHVAERDAAHNNWRQEVAEKPELFDGRIVLQHRLAFRNGMLEGEGHVVPYSTFLWWRRQVPPRGGFHVFAFAVPVSSDGAIIAIRMAAKTVNAGKVYCAAGSLEAEDVVDGLCDVEGNMRRELREETGLDLAHARADAQLHASHAGRRVTLYRVYRFDLTAAEMTAAVEAHMATDHEQEIDGVVAIRSGDLTAHAYNAPMLPLLRWFFGEGP